MSRKDKYRVLNEVSLLYLVIVTETVSVCTSGAPKITGLGFSTGHFRFYLANQQLLTLLA